MAKLHNWVARKYVSWQTPDEEGQGLAEYGLILALSLWSVYLWNMATPGLLDRAHNLKGTDFLHFYTLGAVARSRSGVALYNLPTQADLAACLVPAAAGIRYLPLYPPQVSIFFAPFAHLFDSLTHPSHPLIPKTNSNTPTIRPDTIFIPYHWGEELAVNQLTNPALDPTSKIPEYKACAARVEKIRARELPLYGQRRRGAERSAATRLSDR